MKILGFIFQNLLVLASLTILKITADDIVNCISTGEIIKQYEDDKPLPSCLILGKSCNGKPLHIVVSNDDNFIYLITAYYPDPSVWKADFKTRKEL